MIPSYLKKYAREIFNKNGHCKVDISCTCGCNDFYFYKRKKSKEEIMHEKEAKKRLIKELGHNFEIYSDLEGKVFLIKRIFFGKIIKKVPIEKYDTIIFKNLIVIKCRECRNVIILFDENTHGYNGVYNNESNNYFSFENLDFSTDYYKFEVDVYYELNEMDASIEDSSIAFDRIKIIKMSKHIRQVVGDFECS